MIEYLLRIKTEEREFIVSAGFDRGFAQEMYRTFTLRDANNNDVPHTKQLVESHSEEKDTGTQERVNRDESRGSFSDFEEDPKEKLARQMAQAERMVDRAVFETDTPEWVKRSRKR